MSYRVLIVDDSPVMRRFIHRVMDLSGFDCTDCLEAGDGAEALELLDDEWVDVILTDINMPRMNGEEFVRRLEQDDELCEIPVLVVSTDATDSRIKQMLSIGARGYVTKPFTPEALLGQLERLVGETNA
jgi:two-component system, chemotaxis family, chemotaxis protein CheY